jgi:cyclopropane fatty-acyl-phospholipid synthase-like methyltransferase
MIISPDKIQELNYLAEELYAFRESDLGFYSRVFGDGNLNKYKRRLENIGFTGLNRTLDLGCGFGQWAVSMAEINKECLGTDLDADRLQIAERTSQLIGLENAVFKKASSQDLVVGGYRKSFDGIFSYNTIPLTPWREELEKISQLLKDDGLLYFNAYDLGWMCHNIIEEHNTAADFSARNWAIDAITTTMNYERTGQYNPVSTKSSLYVPQTQLIEFLPKVGLELLYCDGDGKISITGDTNPEADQFFPGEKYGIPAVYEILCKKKAILN